MTNQGYNLLICPKCNRTDKTCEEQAEDKDNGNPITYWVPHNWGLSCDECYFKRYPELDVLSDEDSENRDKFNDNDDSSVNTQDECCE